MSGVYIFSENLLINIKLVNKNNVFFKLYEVLFKKEKTAVSYIELLYRRFGPLVGSPFQ